MFWDIFKKSYIVFFAFLFFVIFIIVGEKKIFASEGFVELKGTASNSPRCFVSSLLMQDLNFLIAVTCRGLLYPGDNSVSRYFLWSVPVEGNAQPIKLGELGLGRLEVRSNVPFKELYVVHEKQSPGQKVSESIIMRGGVQKISFLDRSDFPTPTPSDISDILIVDNSQNLIDKISEAFRNATVAFFLFIVVCVSLIFVIFKSKG